MPRPSSLLGPDATVSARVKVLHPTEHFSTRYSETDYLNLRLDHLTVTGKGIRTVRGREGEVVLLRHPDFPDLEIFATAGSLRLDTPGPSETRFSTLEPLMEPQMMQVPEVDLRPDDDNDRVFLPMDDIDLANHYTSFDDPTNTPLFNDTQDARYPPYKEWVSTTATQQVDKRHGCENMPAGLLGLEAMEHITAIQLFTHLFPVEYVRQFVLPATNAAHEIELEIGEFLRFVGIWMLMGCYPGTTRRDFWVQKDADSYLLPQIGCIMTEKRFHRILSCLMLAEDLPPDTPFKDPFHATRALLAAWNDNMVKHFQPSYLVTVGSARCYHNPADVAPGWTIVPRNPYPNGNQYHALTDAETSIVCQLELFEGSDRPRELGPLEFGEQGDFVGPTLRLTRPVWKSGRIVVLDGKYASLQALADLAKRGLFANAAVKQVRHWPKFVHGDEVLAHMVGKPVGTSDSREGCFDGVDFQVAAIRDTNHTPIVMTTYGTLMPIGEEKQRKFEDHLVVFKYPQVHDDYFRSCHALDDHNRLREGALSIEQASFNSRWALRQLAFLLSVTEANTYLAYNRFVRQPADKPKTSQLRFRRLLAEQLISNPYVKEEGLLSPQRPQIKRARIAHGQHSLVAAPLFTGAFRNGQWKQVKSKYLQRVCTGKDCRRQVRTYCICDPTKFWCNDCHLGHVINASE